MRYFVANYNGIPYKAQPPEGYTLTEAKERIQREAARDAHDFGGSIEEHAKSYLILDQNFHEV